MSTVDKLNKVLETKEAIKQAIIDKGQIVGDVFAEYPTAIQNIQSGSGTFVVPAGMKFAYSDGITEFPEDWDWSEVGQATNHSRRFYNCSKLTKLPKLTITNATDTSDMFYGCSALREIDTSNWDLSKITDTGSMFYGCKTINELDMSNWDLSKVTDMEGMFSGCSLLKSVKWGEFKTNSNKSFRQMFNNCGTLSFIPELDCSSNTSTYSQYNSPLYGCISLRNFGGFKGINKSMYCNDVYCLSYESLLNIINGLADGVSGQTLTLNRDLVNQLTDDDIAIATNKGWSISPAKTITEPIVVTDLSQIPSGTTAITPRTYDFSQYTGELSGSWKISLRCLEGDLSNVSTVNNAFNNTSYLVYAYLKTNISGSTKLMFNQCTKLIELTGLEGYITDAESMFAYCRLLESVDLSKLDTSQCTSMRFMFEQSGLKEIPVINNTSQCVNMDSLFSATYIITADLRGWDLSKVTIMNYMFSGCSNLQSVYMDSELNPNLSVLSMFLNITTEGTFYYNPAYDYSKIIAVLPATWTAVPLTE